MKDYATCSFWLETCGDDLTPRPSLDGWTEVDVAILGAGFTGLWTAYYLLRREPALRVAVVEREIAGFGASGRNGGWCTSAFPVSPAQLAARFGRAAAWAVHLSMVDAVEEVGRISAEEGIDAQYRKGGRLLIARGRHQMPAVQHVYTSAQTLGLADRQIAQPWYGKAVYPWYGKAVYGRSIHTEPSGANVARGGVRSLRSCGWSQGLCTAQKFLA